MDMKPILKVLLFLFVVVLLDQCERDEPNPKVNIPDENFLNALIEQGVDINGDSIINHTEAEAINCLWIINLNINDLKGIEAFVNLDKLHCNRNKLTNLDVSKNIKLIELGCFYNKLITLNLPNTTSLKRLLCYGNNLTSLDVKNNTDLLILSCGDNQITGLDISKCKVLEGLDCSDNQITSLDISNNPGLSYLDCSSNLLTTLDVSKNKALKYLDCGGNTLTSLDVSNNTALGFLYCGGNQFTNLDISDNVAIGTLPNFSGFAFSYPVEIPDLDISNMPALYEVCVWEMPFPPAGILIDITGSPNVYFTTDCSK